MLPSQLHSCSGSILFWFAAMICMWSPSIAINKTVEVQVMDTYIDLWDVSFILYLQLLFPMHYFPTGYKWLLLFIYFFWPCPTRILPFKMPPPTFSFKFSNGICGKSPYVSNIAGPLCPSSITFSPYLPLHSLVPEVEVTRTVTLAQSDKMHNRWCCRESGTSGEASTTTKVHAMES